MPHTRAARRSSAKAFAVMAMMGTVAASGRSRAQSYLFHRHFQRVKNCLCWLRLISVVSPQLGLLGAVWGMADVFRTMGGVIAIPTLACYYGLMLKFRGPHLAAIESTRLALTVFSARKLCGSGDLPRQPEEDQAAAVGAAEVCND